MSDDNPYAPPLTKNSQPLPSFGGELRIGVGRCILMTALVAIAASIPLAGLIGVLLRFPVPFAGYISGLSAFLPAMVGVLLYGALGGVFVQAAMGSIGGLVAYLAASRNPERLRWLVLGCGTVSALPGLLLLAMLDWIIGPW